MRSMDRGVRQRIGRGVGLAAVAATCAVACLPAAAGAKAKHKPKPVKVTVKVSSTSQATVRKAGTVRVKLTATGRTSVRVRPADGRTRAATVAFKRRGSRTIALKLTSSGRTELAKCGRPKIAITAQYGKKKLKASRSLTQDGTLCTHTTPPPPPPSKVCDPVATGDPVDGFRCLLPFPDDYYSKVDPSTATGRRLNLTSNEMPRNAGGQLMDPSPFNANDGFSPNSPIVTRVPGLDSKAALTASGIAQQTDIAKSLDPGQSIMVINATTGKQEPIWTEVDMSTSDPAKRTIMIHGAQVFPESTRFIVVLRNLKDAGGNWLHPTGWFQKVRDGQSVPAATAGRAAQINGLLARLAKLGVARSSVYRTWDFTTASEENLTERALAMRNDAYHQLGDDDLADGIPSGSSPQVTITNVLKYTPAQAHDVYQRVKGTIKVPCYMTNQSITTGAPTSYCNTGTRLNLGANGLPTQARDAHGVPQFYNASFTCMIGRSAPDADQMASDTRAMTYGHGLLGDSSEVEANKNEPGMIGVSMCAADWIGMSANDIPSVLKLLPDMNRFATLPDRSEQGLVDFMYLGRWMISQAPGGMSSLPDFQPDPNDPSVKLAKPGQELFYVGGSQGGIMGGALAAVEPDATRATLIVPAIGYSTLLYRSQDFNKFLGTFKSGYPDPADQEVVLTLIQTLWDRGEGGGYALHMTDDPLPDTPPHKIVLVEGFGDHEVSNVQTETEARTIHAVTRPDGALLDAGRSPDVTPFWGIPHEPLSSFTQPGGYQGDATFIPIDIGPARGTAPNWAGTNPNPTENQPPVGDTPTALNDGENPHTVASRSAASLGIVFDFLKPTGGVTDTCSAKPCYAGGWTGP
jgi:hypothetical protein